MSSSLNSSTNASTSNEGSGRTFTASFSGQSRAASPGFHHAGFTHGLHNTHGNINWGTLGSINSGLNIVPSAGVQQQDGTISNARFASSDLPIEFSKMSLGSSLGHSGLTTRGGLGVSPMGNAGFRITRSMGMGNMVAGGSMGRALSSGGGLSTPSLGSQPNLAVNNRGVLPQGSPQVLAALPGYKGSNADYQMGLHHKEQLHEDSILMMQPQLSMGRSGGFSLGGEASTSHHPQPQQNAQAVSSSGVSFQLERSGGFSLGGAYASHHPQQQHNIQAMSSSGVSLQMERSGGFSLGGAYTSLHPQQQHNTQAVSSSGVSLHGSDIFTSSYPSYHSQSQRRPLPTGIEQQYNTQAVSSSGVSLHGSDIFTSSYPSYHSQAGGPLGIGLKSTNSANSVTGMGYDQHHQNTSQYHMPQMSAASQPFRDVGLQSVQATQSNPDRFGLLGLLPVIKKTNPDLTTLALGMDLTTLGLDMTSTKDLYKTFASPWSNEPAKPDPEFSIPQCFYAQNPPPLSEALFRKLRLETLFYVFYSMPKDEAQIYAAIELDNRGWFYHKELKLWFSRVGEPLVKTDKGERGTYEFLDPNSFKIVQKENYVVYYEMLEKKPSLPQHRV